VFWQGYIKISPAVDAPEASLHLIEMTDCNETFQHNIGYKFKSPILMQEALRASNMSEGSIDLTGNKRLALVGDSVLSVMLLNRWYGKGGSTGKFFSFQSS
jgi:hypothetical protein